MRFLRRDKESPKFLIRGAEHLVEAALHPSLPKLRTTFEGRYVQSMSCEPIGEKDYVVTLKLVDKLPAPAIALPCLEYCFG